MSTDQTGSPAPTQEKGARFSAYVLFSEPLQFTTTEIVDALSEDYPALEIDTGPALDMSQACDTDDFITVPLLLGAKGADGLVVTLTRLPGYGQWDPQRLAPHHLMNCRDLPDRLSRNRSYICVSVAAQSDDPVASFRAARLCSCVAAVFARLPVALAAFWETADHFLSPDRVIAMADAAMSDSWPLQDWVAVLASRGTDQGKPVDLSMGCTKGVAPFKGFEFTLPASPLTVVQCYELLMAVSQMTLSMGNEFKDGDTMGFDTGAGPVYRIRHAPKGFQNASVDMLLLLHPDTRFDADGLLGPTASVPPPPGTRAPVRSEPGFFKRLIRGGRGA